MGNGILCAMYRQFSRFFDAVTIPFFVPIFSGDCKNDTMESKGLDITVERIAKKPKGMPS